MTQKDKVKELVGRGLNSYHTKSLQQIDRIEKKNKEQNHKISILSNELDNDYLTKTEEGSVVSLEHSKEGMVYLDELQGNTLVNYCTDGSKEMTLNGDIDVEGTFVTTTEGVDNGKVDIMCEGNTLVNLKYGSDGYDCNIAWANSGTIEYFNRQEYSKIHCKGEIVETANNLGISWIYHVMGQVKLHFLKPNTTYTIKLNNKYDCITSILIQAGNATNSYIKSYQKIDKDTYLIITKDSFEEMSTDGIILYGTLSKDYKGNVDYKIIGMFEGDWSNKELPNDFFEGMKSVGQDDENGHKIEILSQNKNLVSELEVGGLNSGDGAEKENNGVFTIRNKGYIKVEPNTTYTLSIEDNNTFEGMVFHTYDINKKQIEYNPSSKFTLTTPNNAYYLRFRSFNADATNVNTNLKIQLEKGNIRTSYVPHSINKKEILLNEPLRGLPNGVKDRFVKLGGKWYIERNCVGYTPDTSTATFRKHYNVTSIIDFKIDNIKNRNQAAQTFYMECLSTIPYGDPTGTNWQNETHWLKYYPMTKNTISPDNQRDKGSVSIFYNKEWTDQQIIDWCNNNNLKFILPCETPTYEEITDVELMTYLDTTHISNNSTIPCNMKIKNSGYNVIIKPSTLYTVALDTNKSGTVGINLGGAKGTTTNNVATITTPATLTDDSLRLYGKGIKGSKVRLLEGDKTNWIPSHFEGMKSSFEDKFDATDNTYKMEILSNNINLFDKNIFTNLKDINKWVGEAYKNSNVILKLKPNTKYTMSIPELYVKNNSYWIFEIRDESTPLCSILNWSHNNSSNSNDLRVTPRKITFTTKSGYLYVNAYMNNWNILETMCEYLNKDFMLVEGTEEKVFVENKSNKIQFSSIEPLRKWDRFVFKNGQLMIERGSKVFVLDGNTNGINYTRGYNGAKDTDTNMLFSMKASKEVLPIAGKDGRCSSGICNILPNIYTVDVSTKDVPIGFSLRPYHSQNNYYINIRMNKNRMISNDINGIKDWLNKNNLIVEFPIIEPTYEEIPFELQKIILEGYENGTLFIDTNIPPTSTVTYAGETPIVKATKLNKTEVLNNTNDINDNIVPYLMDMDYRVVCLQLQSENTNNGVSMARLFGGTYEMLQRDIQSKRYSIDEYRHRLDAYLDANKITEEEYNKLGDMLNE